MPPLHNPPSPPPEEEEEEDDTPQSPSNMSNLNPYTVLSLPKDAPASAISSAYRRAALKHHPDKASPEDKAIAHTKFQEVAFAYAILSDERRRARFDATGSTSESIEDDEVGGAFDWMTFYREQFAEVVNAEKIEAFEKEWRGSEEERKKVLEMYEKYEGRMIKIYEEVMLSDPCEDEERYRAWIDEAIAKGEVEGYEKYVGESEKSRKQRLDKARKRKAKEAKEAEAEVEKTKSKSKKKGGDDGMGDLAALIQQRQKGRQGDFFASLEEKYASGGAQSRKGGTKRGSEAMDEPSEEAFAKNRKRGKAAANGYEDDGDEAVAEKKGNTYSGSGGRRRRKA